MSSCLQAGVKQELVAHAKVKRAMAGFHRQSLYLQFVYFLGMFGLGDFQLTRSECASFLGFNFK